MGTPPQRAACFAADPLGTLSVSVRIEQGTVVASTGEILYPPPLVVSIPPSPVAQWDR
jgi:hypothetical protein